MAGVMQPLTALSLFDNTLSTIPVQNGCTWIPSLIAPLTPIVQQILSRIYLKDPSCILPGCQKESSYTFYIDD
jgi:hypothetical protein